MRKKVKDLILFIFAVTIFYGILFALGFTCPIKALTGISCPGCGMTRAFISLLNLKPSLAFYYHPLFPLVIIFAIAFFFKEKIPERVKKYGIIFIIFVFFLTYFLRMVDPGDDIVVCRPKDSLIYKSYELLVEK